MWSSKRSLPAIHTILKSPTIQYMAEDIWALLQISKSTQCRLHL